MYKDLFHQFLSQRKFKFEQLAKDNLLYFTWYTHVILLVLKKGTVSSLQ